MKKTIFALIIVFVTNFVGMYFSVDSFWWFDMSIHFLGGFFMAMLMFHYLKINELRIEN